jgi:transcriptional regulator with XRE-family HTH domain
VRDFASSRGERVPAVTGNMVSRWERGIRSPRPRYIRLLCGLFNLPAVDLGLLGIDDLSREIRPPPLEAGQESGQSASVDTVAPPGWYRNDDDWGMVGRDDAMHALSQVLPRTREGSGQMIVITGEAGIGKTRLCRQMMTTAWTHGYTVLLGHCNGRGLSEPFVPMIEAIRNHLAVSDVRSIRRTLGSGYRELQRFFPRNHSGHEEADCRPLWR